jgi:predicted transposase/invertase (TIGR01784 family)
MQHPELAHPHDLLVRYILTDPELMADLLQYYPQNIADQQMVKLLDLKRLECKSPVVIDERLVEKIGDLKFSASFKGGKRKSNVFLLFEHQSTIDPDFRLRGLDCIVQSYKEFRRVTKGRQKLPYPVVVVLYHGKIPWKHLPVMDEMIDIAPGVKTGLLEYQLILIDVSELSVEQFRGHPVLQVLLELLQLASKNRLVREFDRIISRLLALKNDPRIKDWLKPFARYAMSVAKIGIEQIIQAFSKILNEKEAYNMAMTTAEELIVKGEARGKIEGKKETILDVLKGRFGKVPKSIINTVQSYSDLTALQSLSVLAGSCESLDEFAEGLR